MKISPVILAFTSFLLLLQGQHLSAEQSASRRLVLCADKRGGIQVKRRCNKREARVTARAINGERVLGAFEVSAPLNDSINDQNTPGLLSDGASSLQSGELMPSATRTAIAFLTPQTFTTPVANRTPAGLGGDGFGGAVAGEDFAGCYLKSSSVGVSQDNVKTITLACDDLENEFMTGVGVRPLQPTSSGLIFQQYEEDLLNNGVPVGSSFQFVSVESNGVFLQQNSTYSWGISGYVSCCRRVRR